MELMCNALLMRGDDLPSLPKCLEASEHRYGVLEESGFSVTNPKFRDALMREHVDGGQDTSELHLDLNG